MVGVRNDDDVVLARDCINADVGDPGRSVCDSDCADIDTFRSQRGQRQLAEHVITNCADHVRRCARADGRDRLIRSFAA